MNVASKNLLAAALFATVLFSCTEQDMNNPIANDKAANAEVIDFMGEKVIVKDDFPVELLNQSQKDFDKYYKSVNNAANLRMTADEVLTYEELGSIIAPLVKKYPDVSIDREISETDQKRIYADFPNVKTVTQIREKSHIILAYYEALLKREAVPAVVNFKKNKVKSGLRTNGIGDPFGHMKPYEESVAMNHPRYVPGYTLAAGLAVEMANRYGSVDYGQRGDALRHGAWNCLTIRNTIILGASRDGATDYAQQCTTAHEIECGGCYEYDLDTTMDLFNNISARTWMRSQVSWGVGVVRDMPTESRIEMQMRSWADNAGTINVADYANHIALGVNNEPRNWGLLYGAGTWQFQHLMVYR